AAGPPRAGAVAARHARTSPAPSTSRSSSAGSRGPARRPWHRPALVPWPPRMARITRKRTESPAGWPARVRAGRPWRSAVVDELQRDVQVRTLEHRDDGLQVVAALARDADLVARDRGLDALRPLVAHELGDLLGVLARDALLDARLEAVLLAGRPGLAAVEGLERDAAAHELALEDVEHGLDALLGVRRHDHEVLAAPGDRGVDAPEVVALRDLLGRLVQRVVDLLPVDLADDVERGLRGHGCFLLLVGPADRGGLQACYPSIRGTDVTAARQVARVAKGS